MVVFEKENYRLLKFDVGKDKDLFVLESNEYKGQSGFNYINSWLLEKDFQSKINPVFNEETYITQKGRKLSGNKLKYFLLFWEEFNLKKGKAVAADAWYDITMNRELAEKIIKAARREAYNRPQVIAKDKTPIHPQGWLSQRRWEDYER